MKKKSRQEQVKEISEKYLNKENEIFRSRLISVISGLTEEQLAVLAEFAEMVTGQKG